MPKNVIKIILSFCSIGICLLYFILIKTNITAIEIIVRKIISFIILSLKKRKQRQ